MFVNKMLLKGIVMLRDSITMEEVVAFLNNLLQIDCIAMSELVGTRVRCNPNMADHPSVQVMARNDPETGEVGDFRVGIFGILNGMFGIQEDGMGPMLYLIEDNTNKVIKFMTQEQYKKEKAEHNKKMEEEKNDNS